MNKILKNLKSYSLSSIDMMKMINNKANLITYPEIANYDNIEDLMGKDKAVIILYLTDENYGHWTTVFLNPKEDTLIFFDSYGMKPDTEIKWIKNNPILKEYPKDPLTRLIKLMSDSKYKIDYNDHKLQKTNNDIATCGRWVGIRLLMRNLTNEQFFELFKSYDNLTPDDIVTLLSYVVLGK